MEKMGFLVFSSFQVENVKSDEKFENFEKTGKIRGLTGFWGICARRRKFLSFVARLGIKVVQGVQTFCDDRNLIPSKFQQPFGNRVLWQPLPNELKPNLGLQGLGK